MKKINYIIELVNCYLLLNMVNLHAFFSKSAFQKNSNSLDPDQAKHIGGAILGLNCLQWLSEDDTSGVRVKK